MIAFLLLSLPIVACTFLGWVAVSVGWASPDTGSALGTFSYRFALPALVLRLVASQPLAASFNAAFFGGYMVSGGLVFALILAIFGRLKEQTKTAVAGATAATVSNLGFLGTPILLAVVGPRGVGPLAMAMVCEVMILFSIGALLMSGNEASPTRGKAIVRGLIRNPVIEAIAVGAVLATSGYALPATLDRALGFLGASAAPAALFAVGSSLARPGIVRTFDLALISITATKLIAYPALVWAILAGLLQLDPFWVRSGVLLAALPSASSNFVLAQQYAAGAERVSAVIALSTVVSVATVPCFAWLLIGAGTNGPGPM